MLRTITLWLGIVCTMGVAGADVVNVYSARHYDTDDMLYKQFTEQTGIQVKVIEGKSDALLERLKREGKRSPADVFITVDAGRLNIAEDRKVFQSINSRILRERVPEYLRHPEGLWFGLTKRVRVILYSKERVEPCDISNYEGLSDLKWRNRVLIRSSSNVYNQSLVGSFIEVHGKDATLKWCEGLVANMARRPQGGDRDQIRGVAAGEGDVAVVNHYYFAHLLTSEDPVDREVASKVAILFPNQSGRGAHVNISGAGVVRNAPHKENAVRFLEFLVSNEAQEVFAVGSHEYPVIEDARLPSVLKRFGEFKGDEVSAYRFGRNNQKAIRIMDRAGWR